jgi:phosphatidylinositol kinase/protein kinase (PI-3  family)
MHVITSKQRPRRLHIHGSDGKDYGYLLKGHEDLRQDERVMQLFGLVNSLLANTPSTSARDLSIARYAVVPLSPNSGLIGWVPNCDTLHALIREHRDAHKVPLNLEQRLMLAMAPDYDHLPLVNKVRFFLRTRSLSFFGETFLTFRPSIDPRRVRRGHPAVFFSREHRARGDARVEDLRGDATTHID